MPATTERLKDLVTDLRSNWYVRFWFVLWIPFAILAFVCLVELGHRSEIERKNNEVQVDFKEEGSMVIPNFHFHTGGVDAIDSLVCTHMGVPVQGAPCQAWGPFQPTPLNCQAILASQIVIQNVRANNHTGIFELGINCNITTIGNDSLYGQSLGWGFDGWGDFVGGPVGHTAFYLHPTGGALIALVKGEIVISSKFHVDDWGAQLQYWSSNSTPGFFHVRIQILGFGVFKYRLENVYDGWKAIGGIGGFFFFMVILHTIVMIIVGFFFSNKESAFLNPPTNTAPQSREGEYAPVIDKS